MTPQTIVVCDSDYEWTLAALRVACSLAKDMDSPIIFLKMVSVDHPLMLGQPDALWRYTAEAQQHMETYLAVLEDYGVQFSASLYECVSYADALVSAVEQLDTAILFATLPRYAFPFRRRLEMWYLRHRLNKLHCTLYTLDTPPDTLIPVAPTPAPAELLHVPSRLR